MVAASLSMYNIYAIQPAFLLQVAVNMDKAACHLSNIKRCARACTGTVLFPWACAWRSTDYIQWYSIPLSLIVHVAFYTKCFPGSWKLLNKSTLRHWENLGTRKGRFLVGLVLFHSPQKMGKVVRNVGAVNADETTASRENALSLFFGHQSKQALKSMGVISLTQFLLHQALCATQDQAWFEK